MEIRDILGQLPDPSPEAEARVWARLHQRRTPRARWLAPVGFGGVLVAASMWLFVRSTDPVRVLEVNAEARTLDWSPTLDLEFQGVGTVKGRARDVEVTWASGALRATVAPESGTRMVVLTDEARVEVVGTVFEVTRDRLGTTTRVERGRVRVTCTDGTAALVDPADSPSTCAPTTAAGLLARADALADAVAPAETVQAALDAGIARSEPRSAVRGELLVRRMVRAGDAGHVSSALADARAYFDGPSPRGAEVRRYAGWLAHGSGDCAAAREHLTALGAESMPADRVLLAECLTGEVQRARALLDASIPHLDAAWAARAQAARAALEGR